MIVQCAKCGTKFRLDEAKIGLRGAKVRCAKCQNAFVVKRPAPEVPEAGVGSDVTAPLAMAALNPQTGKMPIKPTAIEAQATVPSPFHLDTDPQDLAVPKTAPAAPPAPVALELDDGPTGPRAQSRPTAQLLPTTDPDGPPATIPTPDTTADDFSGNAALFGEVPGTSRTGTVHEVRTAVYMVPPEFRAGESSPGTRPQSPKPALTDDAGIGVDVDSIDLDGKDSEATQVAEAPPTARKHATPPAPPSGADLPTLPIPTSTGSPVPVDDVDLVDDDDVTLMAQAPGPSASAAPGSPHASSGGSPPPTPPAEEPFGDPFAAMAEGGAISADGTVIPPTEVTGDPGAPSDSTVESQATRATLNRIESTGRKAAPARAAASAPPAASASDTSWSIGVKILVWVMGMALLSVGVLFYLGGGHFDLSVIGVKAGGQPRIQTALGFREVQPVAMRSVLYPTRAGNQLLVFAGTAENRSGEPRSQIDVIAELYDEAGRVLATERAPLGLVLSPGDIAGLSDRNSVAEAFKQLVAKHGPPLIQAGGTAPFTVVMTQPPAGLGNLIHRIRLEKGEALAQTPAKPTAPPPADEVTDDGDKTKGKKGAKDKAKQKKGLKGKRKAKAADLSITP
jgi:predicted Zn finger-like uncharacterized protein